MTGDIGSESLRGLLERATTIAVVGASTDPTKTASRIPALLLDAGFSVLPVHPSATEILGQPVFASLAEIGVPVDIVDVFRPAEEAPEIAAQAVAIGAGALWLQQGIASPEARRIAGEAGMVYVEDRCIGATVRELGIRKDPVQPRVAPPRP